MVLQVVNIATLNFSDEFDPCARSDALDWFAVEFGCDRDGTAVDVASRL
jgi:hypothetical protein